MKRTNYKPGNAAFLSQCHEVFCQKRNAEMEDEAIYTGKNPHSIGRATPLSATQFEKLIEEYPDIGLYYPTIGYGENDLLCGRDNTYFRLVSVIWKHGIGSPLGRSSCVSLIEFMQRIYSDQIFYAKRSAKTSRAKMFIRLKVTETRVDHKRDRVIVFFSGYGRGSTSTVYRTSMPVSKAAERFGVVRPEPGTLVEYTGKIKSTVDNAKGAKHPYVGALLGGHYWVVH